MRWSLSHNGNSCCKLIEGDEKIFRSGEELLDSTREAVEATNEDEKSDSNPEEQ